MEMTEICTEAVNHYGELTQIVKAVEEMSELTKELCKVYAESMEQYCEHCKIDPHLNAGAIYRVEEIAEEIADVEIMLEQLKIICAIHGEVDNFRDQKLQRLQRRINSDPD